MQLYGDAMAARRVRDVRVLPDGRRVTVRVEADRIRFCAASFGWADLWEIPLYLVSLLGMGALFIAGLNLIAVGQPVVGATVLVLGFIVGIPILFQLLLEAAGYVVRPSSSLPWSWSGFRRAVAR